MILLCTIGSIVGSATDGGHFLRAIASTTTRRRAGNRRNGVHDSRGGKLGVQGGKGGGAGDRAQDRGAKESIETSGWCPRRVTEGIESINMLCSLRSVAMNKQTDVQKMPKEIYCRRIYRFESPKPWQSGCPSDRVETGAEDSTQTGPASRGLHRRAPRGEGGRGLFAGLCRLYVICGGVVLPVVFRQRL